MKKKIVVFGLVLMTLCAVLCGCVSKETTNTVEDTVVVEGDKFTPKRVASFYDSEHDTTYIYLKDEITNVMYLCMKEDRSLNGYDGTSGLTVMLDPDTGGPLLYDKWLKYVDQAAIDKTTAKAK